MAIQGNGYFVLSDASGALSYTRDGQTQVSSNGTLVGFNGDSVMGYSVNAAGVSSGVLGPIAIPQGVLAPTASTQTTVSGNLDASSPVIAGAINPANPATYSTSVSVQVYDSLGNSHVLTYYYQNAGVGVAPVAETWNWTATLDGSAVGLANNSGVIGFDNTGAIVAGAKPALPLTAAIAGAANLSLNLDFSGLTQYAGGTAATGSADGNAVGRPEGVQIGNNGGVSISYSNGQTVNVAQVAVATFPVRTRLTARQRSLHRNREFGRRDYLDGRLGRRRHHPGQRAGKLERRHHQSVGEPRRSAAQLPGKRQGAANRGQHPGNHHRNSDSVTRCQRGSSL